MTEGRRLNFLTSVDKAGFFFFGVFVFFLPISNAAIESSFGFIFLCFLIKGIFERPTFAKLKLFFSNRINFSLLIFYIAILLSLFAAGPFWSKSLKAWFFKWGEGVLLFYFAQSFLNRKRLTILLWVLITSSVLVSIDGIYQWINGVDFLRGFALVDADRYMGVRASFKHYNGFATFMVASFFITTGVLRHKKSLGLRFLLLLTALLIVSSLLLSHSRGGWMSFLIVNFFMVIFLCRKREKAIGIFFIIFFSAGIIAIPFLRERFLNIIQHGGDADRFKVWRVPGSMDTAWR